MASRLRLVENEPVFGAGRFDDIAAVLTAVGVNVVVRARAAVITPLDPNHQFRWEIVVMSGEYQVLEMARRTPDSQNFVLSGRFDLPSKQTRVHLPNANPCDVAESVLEFIASRIYLRGPLLL